MRVAEKRAWTDQSASQAVGVMSGLKFNRRQSQRISDMFSGTNNLNVSTVVADEADKESYDTKALSPEQSFTSFSGVRKFVEWEVV